MPTAPADPYAIAKVAAEEIVRNLCSLHGLEWVIAVPHNIYGPGQRYWDPYRNVAGIMINRCLLGKPPVVYGDGSQRRCLSYIDDVTGPLLKLATEDVAGEVFNVGPDGFEEGVQHARPGERHSLSHGQGRPEAAVPPVASGGSAYGALLGRQGAEAAGIPAQVGTRARA